MESPLKKESTSKKNKSTHRNRMKNLNTTSLPYSFTVEKFLYSSFLLSVFESTCFLKQCNSFRD